ncbi:hypothetical protein MKW98_019712 [Papaver atlanticum]|uniref:Uncharacterized protein n=1 Tax=Papaver atlanticum TaxID=357466 RepID=A0AAD4TCS4_9MAGN|nr:hypothetical protein MKW98_019712 [Papaver atlanticum]
MMAAVCKLDHHQTGAFAKKLTENPNQHAALRAKVKEALTGAVNPMEGTDAIVDIITQWSFEVGNTSQLDVIENAPPLSNGDPSGVKIPPSVIEGHVIDIRGTHPVEASLDGTGAGSDDAARYPRLLVDSPFNFSGAKFSGMFWNSDSRGTHLVEAFVDGTGAGSDDAARHPRLLVDNPSNFHGDKSSGIIGNSDGLSHNVVEGVLYLPMGMIAQVGPGMIQVAGSTEKAVLKVLLLCIDISASLCFLGCCLGFLGLVVNLLECKRINPSFLKKAQKVGFISATSSLVIFMLLALAYIPAALYW